MLAYYINKNEIWWDNIDYDNFRFVATSEIIQTINQQKINYNIKMSAKDAMIYLYQP
jgi:hypothetical protein